MALAEPALRTYGLHKLQGYRLRGGSLLGTAIGTGIGIGYSLTKDWEVTFPWSSVEQPRIRKGPGVNALQEQTEQGSYQQYKTHSTSQRFQRRKRSRHNTNRGCCCTSCHC